MVTEAVTSTREIASPFLDVDQVEVTYNRTAIAVQGISLQVAKGEIVAIIGANGAGKTTILRAIAGFLPGERAQVTEGSVTLSGLSLEGKSPHAASRTGVALVPERDKVFITMSVMDNLRLTSMSTEVQGLIDRLFPVLNQRHAQLAGYLSGGERQMLAIAMALQGDPQLLLADELSLGVAPILVRRLMEALVAIRDYSGVTVLMVEQNASAALKIADYVYVMEGGRVVLDGTPARLMEHEDVREFYLGIAGDAVVGSYADVKQYRRKRRWWG